MATFDLESTPGKPYKLDIADLLGVETDMAQRQGSSSEGDCYSLTLTCIGDRLRNGT